MNAAHWAMMLRATGSPPPVTLGDDLGAMHGVTALPPGAQILPLRRPFLRAAPAPDEPPPDPAA